MLRDVIVMTELLYLRIKPETIKCPEVFWNTSEKCSVHFVLKKNDAEMSHKCPISVLEMFRDVPFKPAKHSRTLFPNADSKKGPSQ